MKKHPLEKWGDLVGGKRSRWITLALWLVIVGVLAAVFPQVSSVENFAGDDLPEEMMSREASALIKEQFPSDSGIPLLIVWYKEAGLEIADLQGIQSLYSKLAENPLDGQTTLPPLGQLPTEALLGSVSDNGKSIVTPVFFSTETNTETLQENLEKISGITEAEIGENPYTTGLEGEELRARFSGPVGIAIDATALFSEADVKLMTATVVLILVLLIVLYRSPLLAVIPILVVGVAFLAVSPLLGWFAENGWISKDAQAVAIMTVLLFGAGTDYCLFLITRYRDVLLEEENRFLAISRALKESAGAIAMSALTVVIGLATLGLANYGAFQRFAVPFSFGVLLTGVAVLTLLPAILAILGRAAFWPFIPRTVDMEKKRARETNKLYKEPKENHRFMRKVGNFATGKPWIVIIITGAILIGLAVVSTQIKYNYDLLSSFPEDMPSREGFALIEENFTPGELAPVQVLVNTNGATMDVKADLEALPYVGLVKEVRVGAVDANIQLYEVDLNKNPYSNEAMDDLGDMKEQVPSILTAAGLEDAEDNYWLGGETSAQLDTKDVQSRDENVIQPVMIVIILLVLLVYLRAVVTSLQLMVTVVVSFFAALGAGWLILTMFFGAESIASSIPLYAFVFIIALGNDYNIFMISDIWNNRQKGQGHKESIAGGVASTGAVITSAGLILAGTFAVLATLPIQLLVQFGVVTAVGVLLDTFIVRPLLVPAIITVFGRWSYWPGKLFKKDL
ncbi:MMPL family transporter [Solibacillus sp. FSL H8-0538]|uniref:MMPL family transporter n=1 Tax=Solibacillus sp. FSL H8-0538 TaxID=2921400 RepID=UPI0030F9F47E